MAVRPGAIALEALDGARGTLLQFAARTPGLRYVVASRDARLATQSIVSVALVAMATLRVPGLLLLVGPALFGVAHIIGDVRHLVIRRDVPQAWIRVVAIACASLIVLRATELAAPSALPYALVEVILGWSWVAASLMLGARVGQSTWRALLCGALVSVLGVASVRSPALARSIFAYAHNVVALVVWVTMFRSLTVVALPACVAAAAIAGFLASGSLLPWSHLEGASGRQVVADSIAAVGHDVASSTAVGIGLSYVFLQGVHYAAWLAWIPQDDLRGCGTTTFRMTARAVRRELGQTGYSLATAAAIVVAVASLVRAQPTRAVYLSVAAFHGWLELAALAFFVVAPGQIRRASQRE